MRELKPGVWHWQTPHPDWSSEEWWPELVSSYAIELGDDLVLFDPLSVPAELRERATAVVLTAPYHERDARSLGLPVHTPPADTWQDWVEKFGIDPDRVRGMESDDLAWLRAGEGDGRLRRPTLTQDCEGVVYLLRPRARGGVVDRQREISVAGRDQPAGRLLPACRAPG